MIEVASRLVVFPNRFGVDGINRGVPDVHGLFSRRIGKENMSTTVSGTETKYQDGDPRNKL